MLMSIKQIWPLKLMSFLEVQKNKATVTFLKNKNLSSVNLIDVSTNLKHGQSHSLITDQWANFINGGPKKAIKLRRYFALAISAFNYVLSVWISFSPVTSKNNFFQTSWNLQSIFNVPILQHNSIHIYYK